jgi:two-component system cell cycle response regulator DivK
MAASVPSRKTVLIVEDNEVARECLVGVLRRHGYDAISATDGGAALALLGGKASPDLIVLDMLMPSVDGWRFLERIKATPLAATPVIVMTGVGLSPEWAAANGCAGFLRKPFDEVQLVAEIGRVLRTM